MKWKSRQHYIGSLREELVAKIRKKIKIYRQTQEKKKEEERTKTLKKREIKQN